MTGFWGSSIVGNHYLSLLQGNSNIFDCWNILQQTFLDAWVPFLAGEPWQPSARWMEASRSSPVSLLVLKPSSVAWRHGCQVQWYDFIIFQMISYDFKWFHIHLVFRCDSWSGNPPKEDSKGLSIAKPMNWGGCYGSTDVVTSMCEWHAMTMQYHAMDVYTL